MTDIGEVIFGLRGYAGSLGEAVPLIGWGFDPIFLPTERLNRHHLDEISTTRPIAIIYSNFHLMCVNSKALELAGYSRETNATGALHVPDGTPTGELQAQAQMFPDMRRLVFDLPILPH